MPTNYGLITYKKRDGDKVDTDALVKLVKDGVITIESLVGMGSFSASKIKESLPKSAADKVIQSGEPVLYLELRANQEFKNQCQEIVAPMLQDFDVQNTKPVASAEPPVTKKKAKKELAPKEIVKSKKSQSELSKLLGE
ncbi:hypothetical protein EBR03_05840 [bacterium]|nr:hypothetical protein [bacterium]